MKRFESRGEDKQLVIDEALKYLNTYIAPHNLISFSIFEDDHPSPERWYHVVLMFRGDGFTPFKRNENVVGDVYSMSNFRS